MERHPQLSDDGPPEVFGHLCEAIGRRFLAVADELEARVDLLGDDALAAAPNILGEIQLLRREEATIRKMLTPQLRILQQLARLDTPHLNDGARPQLIDAFDVCAAVHDARCAGVDQARPPVRAASGSRVRRLSRSTPGSALNPSHRS